MWNSHFPSKQPAKGILRSKTSRYQFEKKHVVQRVSRAQKDEEEELLIFGYACKIFPPDDHSRDIFKGRHLIPWNGDENLQLMIDRYDARASLHDLSDFDGDSWNTHYDMSEEEARIEQLCDQERYMAMYTDIAEEKLRHEEELKRLHASIEGGGAFNQVGFQYDTNDTQQEAATPSVNTPVQPEDAQKSIEEEKPFMAPSSLSVPPDMEIPPTEKMHAIIEKTAMFVSKQGVQMEIILKAKQANSSQFLFLDFDHYLNPYYKHVLKRIKEGKYTPCLKAAEKEDEEEEDEESDSDEDGGYLHPSLFANAQRNKQEEEEKKEKFKAIQKVDPNHPLAKLIEKGKKANALRQYNLMKLATQNYSPDKENALQPPPLPKFIENSVQNSNTASSPLSLRDQDALPPSITPQEAAMVIVPPPPDIQPMVDSIAKQIAEDGDAVEQSMREREDPLLAFLEPSHELHPYYTFRKTFIREQMKARKRMLQEAQELAAAEDQQKQSNPVSFSIKGKDAVPKTTLISTRLQLLEDESDHEENDKPHSKEKESTDRQESEGNLKETSTKSKEKSKRKFVEISVVEGVKPKMEAEAAPAAVMTPEDKTRLLEQTKRKFTDAPPVAPIPTPSISNFTVVTPDGNTMSIAEFREKQQERRQKAAQIAMEKAKMATVVAVPESEAKKKDPASEDIFGSSEEEEVDEEIVPIAVLPEPSTEKAPVKSEKRPKSRSPSVERKSSPPASAKPAGTLKDLIAEASRSGTPSRDSRRHRSKSRSQGRSRSRSRSRTSSPRRRRKSRSRSRDRDFVPQSYKKILGSSSSRYSKYDDNVSIPSAYKIENPSYSYGNGSYSRHGRRDMSPLRRSHKRYRESSDRETNTKKRRSNSSSRKSKRKHSKSQKKHKKKKSRSKKKKRKKDTSSDESESSNSDSDSSDGEKKKKSNETTGGSEKEAATIKEEGELSPPNQNQNAS